MSFGQSDYFGFEWFCFYDTQSKLALLNKETYIACLWSFFVCTDLRHTVTVHCYPGPRGFPSSLVSSNKAKGKKPSRQLPGRSGSSLMKKAKKTPIESG